MRRTFKDGVDANNPSLTAAERAAIKAEDYPTSKERNEARLLALGAKGHGTYADGKGTHVYDCTPCIVAAILADKSE